MFPCGINSLPSVPGGCLKINNLHPLQLGARNESADAQGACLQKAEPRRVQRAHPVHDVEGHAVRPLPRYQRVGAIGSWGSQFMFHSQNLFCGPNSMFESRRREEWSLAKRLVGTTEFLLLLWSENSGFYTCEQSLVLELTSQPIILLNCSIKCNHQYFNIFLK